MENVRKFDIALSPNYSSESSNDSIQLYKGQLEVEHNKVKVPLNGIIELVWLRIPQIKFSFTDLNPKGTKDIQSEVVSLHIPNCIHPVQIRLLEFRQISDEKGYRLEYSGKVEEPIYFGNRNDLSYVLFQLANFHDTLGNSIGVETEKRRKQWKGRFHLNTDGWKITIDKVENYKELFESLKKTGGYGISHTIKIEKNDRSLFDIKQLDDLKEDLFYFFSFTRGFWTEPFFEIGYDKKGKKVWENFSLPRTDKWQMVSSWFDFFHPEILNNFWITFRKKLQNQIWEEPLKRAIRLYISANQKAGKEEGSIILAQTAHEMLSWTKFVSENGLSQDGFRKLHASDKLKLILSEAKIPFETPSLLKFLTNQADGCKAITEIRNKLVHPEPKHIQALQNIGVSEMQDAYILTMWYLELTLLYLLGYKGKYANRLVYTKWAGQTEDVPWI